jgi:hypothetical protein
MACPASNATRTSGRERALVARTIVHGEDNPAILDVRLIMRAASGRNSLLIRRAGEWVDCWTRTGALKLAGATRYTTAP